MALRKVRGKEMSLVLSSDPKPRLKWTPELHQCFVDAIDQLGGLEKATPKSLMKVMGIQGLTLYHLKSHLQKYRLGRSQTTQINLQQNKREYYEEKEMNPLNSANKICDGAQQQQINESLKVARALQIQTDVQRKLHEQIEVQKHLQLRIEAQGKYLQSVLKKAEQTLSGYNSCSMEVERAKVELSRLASMVDSRCPSSSFSLLTTDQNEEGSMSKDARKAVLRHNQCSLDSSLTSSDSSWKRENEPDQNDHNACENDAKYKGKRSSVVLSLMEMHTLESENRAVNKKRGRIIIGLNH